MGGLFGGGDNGAAEAARQQMKMQEEQMKLQKQELERSRLEQEKLKLAEEAKQRDKAKEQAASDSARRRGGARALLSDARLNPETGLEDTLGSSTPI